MFNVKPAIYYLYYIYFYTDYFHLQYNSLVLVNLFSKSSLITYK